MKTFSKTNSAGEPNKPQESQQPDRRQILPPTTAARLSTLFALWQNGMSVEEARKCARVNVAGEGTD